MPYSGTWKQAIDFNLPLIGSRIEGKGELTQEFSFLSIEPDELVISAVKKAELDDSLMVRIYNITDERVEGSINTYKKLNRAVKTNLNEETKGELKVESNSTVQLTLKGAEIKTIKLFYDS